MGAPHAAPPGKEIVYLWTNQESGRFGKREWGCRRATLGALARPAGAGGQCRKAPTPCFMMRPSRSLRRTGRR